MRTRESALLSEANEQLNRKIPLVNFNFSEWMNSQQTMPFWTNGFHKKEEQEQDARYKDVPLVVAPGHEEAYLNDLAEKEKQRCRTGTRANGRTERRKTEGGNGT